MSEVMHGFRGSERISDQSRENSKTWAESWFSQAKGALVYLRDNIHGHLACAQSGAWPRKLRDRHNMLRAPQVLTGTPPGDA